MFSPKTEDHRLSRTDRDLWHQLFPSHKYGHAGTCKRTGAEGETGAISERVDEIVGFRAHAVNENLPIIPELRATGAGKCQLNVSKNDSAGEIFKAMPQG